MNFNSGLGNQKKLSGAFLRSAFLFISIFILTKEAGAQCTILANAIQGISYTYVQAGGTNASGVAYNPNLNIYYACIAGNPGFPYETFDATGVSLYQTTTGFDFRGLWWNPNTNQVEGTGYSNFGLWTSSLNGSGYALNTGTLIYPGQNQPDAQSCGDYDCEADEMVFYNNGSVSRYARSNGSFLGSYVLTGMPVPVANINWTSCVYTGCLGQEIGIEDYVGKAILLFNKANGAYVGSSQLPATAPTNNGFRFSWANNLAWLYDVNTRTWTSYSIFSGSVGGSGTVDLGNDTTICNGQTVTLDAGNAGANYLWQDGTTNQTYTVTQSGTYIVGVSTGGCYVAHDTIVVTVIGSASSFNLGNDTTICSGGNLLLDATTSGAAYLWQDGSSNPTFNVLATGQYAVTISLNGCTAADTINVNVASLGSLNLGNDTSLCPGANLLLDATTTGATYLWQNNSNSNTFNVTATGTYSVTVTVGNCTPLNDAIVVSYNTAPSVNLGNDTSLCTGQSLLLDATLAGASYLWQNATVNATLNAISTGNYAVTITDINGCTNNDNINVTFNNPPVVNLGNDTTLCGTQTLLLNVATAGGSYLWQDASTNFSYTVTVAGTYYVSVTANNCGSTDTIHVLYNNPPIVFIGNDTTLCPGQTLLLDATTANSVYIWQDNTNTATYTVTAPGTFWVDVTTGTCMPVRDSIIVNYISGSTVFIGNDTTLCPGQTILLDATQAGASYVWQDGTFNQNYSVSNAGEYSVTVTISICTAADTILVNYYSLPVVNLGTDTSICPDEELTLNANNANSTYQWSNPYINTATYTLSDSGTVWVNVTNQCGSASDTIQIRQLICDCKIFVPTAFTPNGDEMNDIFQPKYVCDFMEYDFKIFDRWGELIYSTTDPGAGWDGTSHGLKLNTGVFVWQLVYKYYDGVGGSLSQLKGDVTLLK